MPGVKVNMAVASMVPADTAVDPGVIRVARGTNPVNSSPSPSREMAPLEEVATARVKHPKLNTMGWNTEYAQARNEPSTAHPREKVNRQRRTRREKKYGRPR